MYEPYGYDDATNYISKKDQIERELQINRDNDCKEFASVEYNSTLQAFVFKNVKGVEKGYAYMADILPQELIKSATYDEATKKLIITFENDQVVEIPLDDLIDVAEAGDGLKLEDNKFFINLAEDCERFLTVDENGLLLSGVQDAINVERDRAISAETDEYNRATQAEADLAAAIRAEIRDRIAGDTEINNTIGADFSTEPTETISFKFDALSEKTQKEIDDRTTAVAQEAQLREIGDSTLDGKIIIETNARISGYTELDTKITNEKTRAEGKEADLQTQIDGKADITEVYTKAQVYTKQECDERFSSGGTEPIDAYTKSESDARFQPIGNYLTQNDLNGYATETWVNNQGFLTEHQSLSGYATEQWVESQGYLTEHQDISNLATKAEVEAVDTKVDAIDLTPYATTENVEAALALKADTEVTYTKEDVNALLAEKEAEIAQLVSDYTSLKKIVGDMGGNVTYLVPEEGNFVNIMKNGGTVKLSEDTTSKNFYPGATASNTTTLVLNGKTLTITGLTTSSSTGAITARYKEKLTVRGSGTIDARDGMAIMCTGEDAVFNLEGNMFGASPVYQTNRTTNELIYCYSGTINISGGVFKGNGSPYTLNCYDENYSAGTANIIVTGGKFYDFNPADNSAEGEHTNFVAEGYHVETSTVTEEGVEHTVYTVKKDA